MLTPLVAQAATLEFVPSSLSINEDAETVTVEVVATGGDNNSGYGGGCFINGSVVLGGTATPGTADDGNADFSLIDGTFQVYASPTDSGLAAAATNLITLQIHDDSLVESTETITLGATDLSSDCASAIENNANATITIIDNDTNAVAERNFADIPGLTPTQQLVAQSLDSLCETTASELLQAQCANLSTLSEGETADALQKIAPMEVAAMGTISVETTSTQLANVRARLLSRRKGNDNTIAMNDFSVGINGKNLPAGMLMVASLEDIAIGETGANSLLTDSRVGIFASGRIELGDKDPTDREAGFDFATQGLTLGIDYRITEQFILGGALGYASSDSDYDADRGDLETDSVSFLIYGSYYTAQNYYVDWIASRGNNDYDTRRNIVYSGIDTRTDGKTDGHQLGLSINSGMDFNINGLTLTPYARIEYIDANIDAYRESGGEGLSLAISDQSVRSLTTAVAARLSRAIGMNWGVLIPSAHVELEHEFQDDSRLITASFVEDPTAPFSISTDTPDRNYFNFGLALTATFANGRSAYVSYESVAGRDDITHSAIDLGIRMEF